MENIKHDSDTEHHLKTLGVAVCCDIADEIDSGWYWFVCESGMQDEQFVSELAKRLDSVDGFDLNGRFPIESNRQRQ
jgi:hypothetical protein